MNNIRKISISVATRGGSINFLLPDSVRPKARDFYLGNNLRCDVISSIPGFPDRFKLVGKRSSGYLLYIPSGVNGSIEVLGKSLPLDIVRDLKLLKKKRNAHVLSLPDNIPCTLKLDEASISFEIVETSPPPKVKIDRSIRRSLIARDDRFFDGVLTVSLIIGWLAAVYLNSIEIKIKDDRLTALQNIPQRFAKLILQPRKEVVKPPAPSIQEEEKPNEKEKEKVVSDTEDKPAVETKTEKEQADVREVVPITPDRAAIREKVKSKGLLGVIAAKSYPQGLPVGGVTRGVSSYVDDIKEVESRKSGEETFFAFGKGVQEALKAQDGQGSGGSGGGEKGRDKAEIMKEKKEVALKEAEQITDPSLRKRAEEEIYKVVRSYIGGLKYLYNNAIRKDPTLKGSITVKIVISTEGKVVSTELVSATLESQALIDAMLSRINKWQFPQLEGGEDFTIKYTFDFAPVG